MSHILLIEDDHEVVDFTRTLLEKHGYRIEAVHDGEAGLAAYMTERPSLILLDVFVPRLDGLRFAREIRRRFPADHVPVVVWTGAYEPERIGDLVETPHVLRKPSDSDELLEVVRRALNQDAEHKRRQLRVLCVSTSMPRLRGLVRELRDGFDVHTATRGEEALALLEVRPYEGLVVDLADEDGLAVLRKVAAEQKHVGRVALLAPGAADDPALLGPGAADAVLPFEHAPGTLADRLHAILG
jgi:DNA-binding response OmpR family regulator